MILFAGKKIAIGCCAGFLSAFFKILFYMTAGFFYARGFIVC